MADNDKIVQEVEIRGADQAEKDFERIGKAGESAFEQTQKAADKADFEKVADQVRQVGQAADELQRRAGAVAEGLNRIGSTSGNAFGRLPEQFRQVGQAAADLQQKASAAADEINKVGAATSSVKFDAVAGQVQQFGQETSQLNQAAGAAAESLGKTSAASDEVAASQAKATDQTSRFVTILRNIAIGVGVAVGALATLRGAADSVGESMRKIQDIRVGADAAATSIPEFQRMQFIMEKLGLSAEEARAKIAEMGDTSDESAQKVLRLSGSAKQLTEEFNRQGVRFTQSQEGLNLYRNALGQFAQQASRGQIPVAKLRGLLEEFQDETDPEKLLKFTNALGRLVDQGRALSQVMGEQQGGMGKVIRIQPSELTNLEKADAAFKKLIGDIKVENFQKFAGALSEITDESERTKKAIELLGPKLGSGLARDINEAMAAGKRGEDVIKALNGRFGELKLGLEDTAEAIARRFQSAMTDLTSATEAGKKELALLFAPSLTEGITVFTNLLRGNKGAILEWATSIRDQGIAALEDLFKVLRGEGGDEGGLKTTWVKPLVEGIKSVGSAALEVFDGIVKPAVDGAVQLFTTLSEAIKEAFGANVSPGSIGIVAIISGLLGPVNSLIIVLSSLFGMSEEGFQKIAEFAKQFGIDLNQVRDEVVKFKDDFIAAFKGQDVDNEWVKELVALLKGVPGAIAAVVGAFIVLRGAAGGVARVMASLGFKGATAEGVVLVGVLGGMSGFFKGLFPIVAILTSALVGLSFAIKAVNGLLGTIGLLARSLVFVFGGAAAAAIGFAGVAALIVANWDTVKDLLKTIGIDVEALAKKFDDSFEKSFGVRPLEALGRFLSDVDAQLAQFSENFAKEGILSAAIDLLVGRDLPKLAERLKQFFKDLEKMDFSAAVVNLVRGALEDLDKFLADLEKRFFAWLNNLVREATGIDFSAMWTSLTDSWEAALEIMRQRFNAWLAALRDKLPDALKGLIPEDGIGESLDSKKATRELSALTESFGQLGKVAQTNSRQAAAAVDAVAKSVEKAAEAANGADGSILPKVEDFRAQGQKLIQEGASIAERLKQSVAPAADAGTKAVESVLPRVETFRAQGQQLIQEGRSIGQSLGKVINVPMSGDTILDNLQKSIQDMEKILPPAVTRAKDKVSELGETFDNLPQKMEQGVGDIDQSLSSMTTDFSSANKKILDTIDQVSARIQGSTTGLGKGGNFLTEQFGDASAFQEMVAGAKRAGDAVADVGSRTATAAGEADKFRQKWGVSMETLQKQTKTLEVAGDGLTKGWEMSAGEAAKFAKTWGVSLDTLRQQTQTARVEGGKIVEGLGSVGPTLGKAAAEMDKFRQQTQTATVEGGKLVQKAVELAPAVEKAAKAKADAGDEDDDEEEEIEKQAGATEKLAEGWDKVKGSIETALSKSEELRGIVPDGGILGTDTDIAGFIELNEAITKAGGDVSKFQDNLGKVTETCTQLSDGASTAQQNFASFTEAVQGTGVALQEIASKGTSAGDGIRGLADQAREAAQSLSDSLKVGFSGIVDTVRETWRGLVDETNTQLDQIKQKIQELQQLRQQQQQPTGQPPGTLAPPPGQSTLDPTAPAAPGAAPGGIGTGALDAVIAKINQVKAAASSLASDIASAVNGAASSFEGLSSAVSSVQQSLSAIQSSVSSAFDSSLVDSFSTAISTVAEVAQRIPSSLQGISSAVQQAFDASLMEGFVAGIQEAQSAVDQLTASLQQAAQAARELAAARAGGGGGGAGFVAGGRINGPVGVDRVPLWGTAGEWVIRLGAVRKLVRQFGSGIMQRINMGEIPQFASGGQVPSLTMPSIRLPSIGAIAPESAGPMRNLGILKLEGPDGQMHTTYTDEDTAVALTRVARRSSTNSTMKRAPLWDRGV